MRYVIAGYAIVLAILALYALQLAWRRRRLTRAVARVTVSEAPAPRSVSDPPTPVGPSPDRAGADR